MPFPVTLNGNTYQASDFSPYGYVTAFPAILNDLATVAAGIAAAALAGGTFLANVSISANDAKLVITDTTSYASGVGGMIELDFMNASSVQKVGARLETQATTGTNGAEVADFVVSTMRAGTVTEAFRVTGAGAARHGDGTVSLPGVSFGSDTDNGLYRTGTNAWSLACAGAQALGIAATVISVAYTTASSSSTTGALTVGGGLGVAGKLFVGSDFRVGAAVPVFNGARFTIQDATNAYCEVSDGTRSTLFGADVGGTFVGSYSNHDFKIRTNNTAVATFFTSGCLAIGGASDGGAGNLAIAAGKVVAMGDATNWVIGRLDSSIPTSNLGITANAIAQKTGSNSNQGYMISAGGTVNFEVRGSDGASYHRGASTFASSALSISATAGVGYGTGAGGTVTQATNKSTGVTLNKVTGTITMNNATLNAGDEVSFTVTNSAVAATDVVLVNHSSAGTAGAYFVQCTAVGAGSFAITVSNVSAGNLGEAIVLTFAVIKGVTS